MNADALEKYYNTLRIQIVARDFGITTVRSFVSCGTFLYSSEILSAITNAILLKEPLPQPNNEEREFPREYIDVYKIEDDLLRNFYVLVYDSDELWQTLAIIDVIEIM